MSIVNVCYHGQIVIWLSEDS